MHDLTKYQSARAKYKPERIRCLFIAESPPKWESDRFFYFENVSTRDGLYVEMMKVLYFQEEEQVDTPSIRRRKPEFLRRLAEDGFFLIDAVDEPIAGMSGQEKQRYIRDWLPELIRRLEELVQEDTPIVVLAASVYRECAVEIVRRGFRLINTQPIELPVQGHQPKFRAKLRSLLQNAGLLSA